MSKGLDDIDKIKHPFKVEDGYFDDLTQSIQERVSSSKPRSYSFRWQWSLAPALLVVLALFLWLNTNQSSSLNSEELIAQVSTTDIISYLENSELSEQDLLSLTNDETLIDLTDIDQINLQDEDLEDLMNTFDLNELDI